MNETAIYRPKLTPEHVLGFRDPEHKSSALPDQQIRFPDQYQKFGERVLRYKVKLDTSYLHQSSATVEIWSHHGVGWVELCRVHVGKEFYIVQGPDREALNPRTRELTNTFSINTRGADYCAAVWDKVYVLLYEEAKKVLELIP